MSNARDHAKELLNHYLQLALTSANCKTSSDTSAEIDQIVDHIIDAAVEETLTRITRGMHSRRSL